MMSVWLFWGGVTLFWYTLAGYPCALAVWNRFAGRGVQPHSGAQLPTVAVILSVYNEEKVIAEKIRNFQAQTYPAESLELLIVSDGSTDATEAIVRQTGADRVRLLVQTRNAGKTAALNRAVRETQADLLVFTDANSMFAEDAVTRMAELFTDPAVGLVSGRTEYVAAASGGDRLYRRYEDWLKALESRLYGIVGADGAIYALRRSLYEPLEPAFINDLMHPMQVALRGLRALQCDAAICRERTDGQDGGAYKRQVRIMTQSWLVVLTCLRPLLQTGRFGFVWQVMSHKVLRWLVLPLMAMLFVLNLSLAGQAPVYGATMMLQIAFYGCAALFRRSRVGLLRLPFQFLVMHASGAVGLFRCLRGDTIVSWAPRAD